MDDPTLCCPQCGATEHLQVEALVLIEIDTGYPIAQQGSLFEWNGDSDMRCGQCGHRAKAEAFGEPSIAHISDEDVAC